MDLLKSFGFTNDSGKRKLSMLDVLDDFVKNCGDYGQILKGGMALHYYYDTFLPSSRNTMDLDLHIKEKSIWEDFKINAFKTATLNSNYSIEYRMGGTTITPNGERVKVDAFKDDENLYSFRIDMNYGLYCTVNNRLKINMYSVESILADKISVICSPKIVRRTKDLYDVFLILTHETFNIIKLAEIIKAKTKAKNIQLDTIYLLKPEYLKAISVGYSKLKLNYKLDFSDVVTYNLRFILPLLDIVMGKSNKDLVWDSKHKNWSGNTTGICALDSLEGTIGGETASGILNLSTFPPFPAIIYNDYITLDAGDFKFVNKNIPTSDRTSISDSLFITTKERTICDLIIDGEYRILMDSLDSYMESHDLTDLVNKAKELGIASELDSKLIEYKQYLKERY